jgi:hypothetical protein
MPDDFGFGGDNNFGGGGGGGFMPSGPGDNPSAGIRRDRDTSDFGGSKMFIPGGFQTLPSKASNYSFDDDEPLPPSPFIKRPNSPAPDDDAPF